MILPVVREGGAKQGKAVVTGIKNLRGGERSRVGAAGGY